MIEDIFRVIDPETGDIFILRKLDQYYFGFDYAEESEGEERIPVELLRGILEYRSKQ